MVALEKPPEVCPPMERVPREHLVNSTDQTFLAEQPLNQPELYDPLPGTLIEDEQRQVKDGVLRIGSYVTRRASHRVGIYTPDEHDPNLPKVLMTTALGTGVKGHNQMVAEEMMQTGFVVIKKGPPRYYGPTGRALSLAEDANEMFGVVKSVDSAGVVGPVDELILYGESQAGMKALGGLAIAQHYDREVVDALLVAACYWRKINLYKPHKQIGRLVGIGLGISTFIRHTTHEQRQKLKGTFNLKDLHHHVTVLPVLTSGETGTFLPHIPEQQKFTNLAFAKDGNSKPRRSQAELKERFPNVDARVIDDYGHVDGIMSPETASLRNIMLFEAKHSL